MPTGVTNPVSGDWHLLALVPDRDRKLFAGLLGSDMLEVACRGKDRYWVGRAVLNAAQADRWLADMAGWVGRAGPVRPTGWRPDLLKSWRLTLEDAVFARTGRVVVVAKDRPDLNPALKAFGLTPLEKVT